MVVSIPHGSIRQASIRQSDKVLERLSALHPKKIDLSLDRMKIILKVLGHPERCLPPVIHIAGTNGKGSTTAYMRAICEAAGLKVHVYSSPHLVRFAERIRLAGKIIDEDALLKVIIETEDLNNNDPITYFEITTAIAIKAFAETPADIVLLEVGLGGRFDATNVVDHPLATVVTPVSLDHEGFLGSGLGGIASEKAGIAKSGCPLITGKQKPEVMTSIVRATNKAGAILETNWSFEAADDHFIYNDARGTLKLPHPNLNGPHQISNAALAIATLRHQSKFEFTEAEFARGITSVIWPARMQDITDSPFGILLPKGSELWLDGGHNPAAGLVIAEAFKNQTDKPLILITGMMSNKDTSGFLEPLAPLTQHLYAVHVSGEDSHSAEAIRKMSEQVDIKTETALNVKEAIVKISESNTQPVRVLICGSLYLAGQVLDENNIIPV